MANQVMSRNSGGPWPIRISPYLLARQREEKEITLSAREKRQKEGIVPKHDDEDEDGPDVLLGQEDPGEELEHVEGEVDKELQGTID